MADAPSSVGIRPEDFTLSEGRKFEEITGGSTIILALSKGEGIGADELQALVFLLKRRDDSNAKFEDLEDMTYMQAFNVLFPNVGESPLEEPSPKRTTKSTRKPKASQPSAASTQ
jgi:hypothetical protein